MSEEPRTAGGLISSYALASPTKRQSKVDTEQEGLVGPVRKVSFEVLCSTRMAWLIPAQRRIPLRISFFNDLGNKTKVVSYDPAKAKEKQSEIYKYDLAGRNIEKTVKKGSLIIKTLYFYNDEQRRIISVEKVTDGARMVTRRYALIFDEQGNQIKASYHDNSISEISVSYHYEFDDKGRVVIIETYSSEEALYHKIVCSYDSRGKLSRKSYYIPPLGEHKRRIFIYESNGRTEEKLIFDSNASLERRIVYRYDESNNLVDVAGYDLTGSLVGRTSHALQYDNVGNWIQRFSQTWNVRTGKSTAEWIEYQVITYSDLQ